MTDSTFENYESDYFTVAYKDMEKVYISQCREDKTGRYIFLGMLVIFLAIFAISQNILNTNWIGYLAYFGVILIAMVYIMKFIDIVFGKLTAKMQKKSIVLGIKQKITSEDGGFEILNDRGSSSFFYSDFKKYRILEDLTWLKLNGNMLLIVKHDAFDSVNLQNFKKSIRANIKS